MKNGVEAALLPGRSVAFAACLERSTTSRPTSLPSNWNSVDPSEASGGRVIGPVARENRFVPPTSPSFIPPPSLVPPSGANQQLIFRALTSSRRR